MEEVYDDEDRSKKPSYVTRAVAARKNAGLVREQELRTTQGVEERANDKDAEVEDDKSTMNLSQSQHKETTKRPPQESPRQKKKS